jgi:hypothetical protein
MPTAKTAPKGTVYLICFDRPLAHAEHYIGFTKRRSPLQRLLEHRANHGARILMACNANGIGYHVARIWRNVDRAFERHLKKKNGARHQCPCCTPALKRFKYRLNKK